MIGQFIALQFLPRDVTHREHLRVTGHGSFVRFKNLG